MGQGGVRAGWEEGGREGGRGLVVECVCLL